MPNLINEDDFARASQLDKIGLSALARGLMGVLKIDRINDIYEQLKDKTAEQFIDGVFSELEINYVLDTDELERIPKEGAFISVSNHPLGGIDGLLLIKTLLRARPDVRVMANFLLTKLEPINRHFLPVNPFENLKSAGSSLSGIREATRHLQNGGGLGIFPAGEVSTYNLKNRKVTDRLWQPGAIRFIRKMEVPVLPVYFEGSNSLMFHLLGIINPMLRTARLPSELFNKRDKTIRVRIGKPISVKEQLEFQDELEYGRFLRAKTYLLGNPLEVKRFFTPFSFLNKRSEEVIEPVPAEKIQAEIDNFSGNDVLLYENQEFSVFCASAEAIPNTLIEIGRLRELTFRGVGEGTGKKIDLDEFDLYYRHLFIWDKSARKIVGAYRLGMGREIQNRYGIEGFYLNTLFKMNKKFNPILNESIELGRSFLAKEYQLKPLSLFLLWKGILYYLLKNPQYRYLIGPVSISGEFSNLSKYLIVEFIKKNHFDYELAAMVKPRKQFKPRLKPRNVDLDILSRSTKDDLKKLDKIVDDIEVGHFRLPALLKKYLSQNARIIAFNIDPDFNNSLDGLVVMDLFNVPESTIRGLAKEMQDEELLQKFGMMGNKNETGK